MSKFKSFPPGWNNINVPTSSRRAMLAGIGTYAPCLPKGIWGQRAIWMLVAAAGPRALPGRSFEWEPPLTPEDWQRFLAELENAAGPFNAFSVYERRRGRPGLLLLLLAGDRLAGFVKARQGTALAIEREWSALTALAASPPKSFQTPRPLTKGTVGEWHYLVTTALPYGMHRMLPHRPPAIIHDEIENALAGLPRPPDTPDHWRPFHGDFTPWNLRTFKAGPPWLIDWEEAGWAPPGADAVFYRASAYAIGRAVDNDPFVRDEAAEFWWQRMRQRTADNLEAGLDLRPLDHGLLDAFGPD